MSAGKVEPKGGSAEGGATPFALHADESGSGRRLDAGIGPALFRRVGEGIVGARGLEEAVEVVLQEVCRAAGWPLAHGLSDSAGSEVASLWWPARDPRFAALRAATERLVAARGRTALRRLAAPQPPGLAAGVAELEPERARAAEATGLEAVCAVPIFAEGTVVAGLEFFLRDPAAEPTGGLRDLIEFARSGLESRAALGRAREAVRRAAPRVREAEREVERTARELRRVAESYALVRQASGEGVWEWDPTEDRWRFSPRWAELLGLDPDELDERREVWFDRAHPEDRRRLELEMAEHLEGRAPLFECRHRILHADGSYRWAVARGLALADEAGRPVRVAGTLADISDLKTLEERASQDVLYHPLTGFPRTALLTDRIEHAIRRGLRHPERRLAVVAVDLEGLEDAARAAGARGREELVLAAGRRVASLLRSGDSVGHGEDYPFAALLEEVETEEEALEVAARVAEGLRRPFACGKGEVRLRPHLGVALSDARYERPESLLLDAGLAAKRARSSGRVELYRGGPGERDAADDLEADLRAAITREELYLEYQPIVALDDGRITGLEALLRWRHPSRGLVAPAHFLPVARRAGLMEELGYWVLRRACRAMTGWDERVRRDFPPSLAVNLSEDQFYDPELLPTTTGILQVTGLDFGRLRFDVPESAFMRDPSRAARILTGLRARGIRVAVDDFGSGFSSISLLHRFPVSALKIDRWFVSGQTAKLRDWDVAQTIVRLAAILDLDAVAEGIETREQFQRLRQMGCRQGQGYFFSGAVRAAEAQRLLQHGYPLDLEAPVR